MTSFLLDEIQFLKNIKQKIKKIRKKIRKMIKNDFYKSTKKVNESVIWGSFRDI